MSNQEKIEFPLLKLREATPSYPGGIYSEDTGFDLTAEQIVQKHNELVFMVEFLALVPVLNGHDPLTVRRSLEVRCAHHYSDGCFKCCSDCNYDAHRCEGCGTAVKHATNVCESCVTP